MTTIPLKKLNCHHCKRWKKDCSGINYKDLNETGNTYCAQIFENFTMDPVDGIESGWPVDS